MVLAHKIFENKKDNYQLFAKINSTSATWYLQYFYKVLNTYTKYKIIDNVDDSTIKEDVFNNTFSSINADLSLTSGDVSLYIEEDISNPVVRFSSWNNQGGFYFIDFNVIPMNKRIDYYSSSVQIIGDLLELEYFFSYSASYSGLDFSNTTNLSYFKAYGAIYFDVEPDLSNNPNLLTYSYTKEITAFNVSNHRLLKTLEYIDTIKFDTNINNTYLPDLTYLNMLAGFINTDVDLNSRNLSSLTTLKLRCNTVTGISTLVNLKTFYLYDQASISLDFTGMTSLTLLRIDDLYGLIGVLDLKPLTSLTSFTLAYAYHPNVTSIDISNGLNSQITTFRRLYVTDILNVKVDNPTDANNGVFPYLSTVWLVEWNGYTVITFI